MALRLADCEEELRTARERLKEVDAKLTSLSQERMELGTVVQGWEAIVAKKRKDSGEEPSAAVPIPPPSGLPEYDEEGGENKTRFVFDQIRANASTGMTARDLKVAAKAAGMKHPASWPYGSLSRLKKRDEILKRKGRFYPKGAPDPALAG